MLITLVTFVHVVICLFLISVVLLQQGKGADMGAAFGGGSQTLFGASGADSLLSRLTTAAAITFMITSVYLASAKHDVGFTGSNLFKDSASSGASSVSVKTEAPVEIPGVPAAGSEASAPTAGVPSGPVPSAAGAVPSEPIPAAAGTRPSPGPVPAAPGAGPIPAAPGTVPAAPGTRPSAPGAVPSAPGAKPPTPSAPGSAPVSPVTPAPTP